MQGEKKPFAMILILVVNILLVLWSLHSFAAKSIENAMGASREDVAEQYATQLLIKEKDLFIQKLAKPVLFGMPESRIILKDRI